MIADIGFGQVSQADSSTRFRLDASLKPLLESLAGIARDRSFGLGFDFIVRLGSQSLVDQRLLSTMEDAVKKMKRKEQSADPDDLVAWVDWLSGLLESARSRGLTRLLGSIEILTGL